MRGRARLLMHGKDASPYTIRQRLIFASFLPYTDLIPSMPNPTRAFLLGPLLKGVSRSFYLTLRVLPVGMRDPIGLAYLLARAADTIADTSLISPEQRLALLLSLRAQVNGATDDGALFQRMADEVAGQQIQSDEKVLLESLGPALDVLPQLSESDRKAVREHRLDADRRHGVRSSHLPRRTFRPDRGAARIRRTRPLYVSGGGLRRRILDHDDLRAHARHAEGAARDDGAAGRAVRQGAADDQRAARLRQGFADRPLLSAAEHARSTWV